MKTHYFAYGSNMSLTQMKERCPNSKSFGSAMLSNHSLCFPRHSKDRNCGVASVERCDGQQVWGVVFELSYTDLVMLDTKEGFDAARLPSKNSYNRQDIEVQISGTNELIRCFTYFGVPQKGIFLPNGDYMNAIVSGAREHQLPAEYVEKLIATKTK